MLTLVGVNHRSAPVEVRERLALTGESAVSAVRTLHADPVVAEAFVLSTCNRVEYLVRTHGEDGSEAIQRLLRDEYGFDGDLIGRHTYCWRARDAVRHLFRVTSGLDSMIVGEPQIHGQVKEAFRSSREAGTTGVVLDRLLQHALSAAKRARSETGISKHAVSVAYAAVELAGKIFGRLDDRRVLMLGAGKMGELVAKHLRRQGVAEIIVCSRNFSRANEAARRFGARAVHWEEGLERLDAVDIVIGCTGATQPVLTKQQVQKAQRGRRSGALFMIDIAVPRDIEPEVHGLDNVYLYDIDALEGVVDENLGERRRAAELAHRIIDSEVAAFDRWRQTQGIAPLIQALRKAYFDRSERELERFRRRLGPLTEGQEQALRDLTRALARKFLDRPTRYLREAADRGRSEKVARLFHDLFDLGLRPEGAEDGDESKDGASPDDDTSGPRLIKGGRDNS